MSPIHFFEPIITDRKKLQEIMKRKETLTKEQATLEKKRRRTNLELLKLPIGAMRTMKEIAVAADLPVTRVFQDVIEAGLAVIKNPESSPYQSMIEFRKTLHEAQDRDRRGDRSGRDAVEHAGNGEVAEGSDAQDLEPSGTVLRLAGDESHEEPSSDALEQRGLSQENEGRDSVPVGSVEEVDQFVPLTPKEEHSLKIASDYVQGVIESLDK